jgi:hypothetical protein
MRNAAWIAAVVFVSVWSVAAQENDALAAQQKLMAKRAAEADAYRKLTEAVYGLQLNSTTHVRDFVTESDQIRGEVEHFIRGIRLGAPVWYDDLSCEVPAEVTVAKVIETLRASHERYYKGNRVQVRDYESVTSRVERNVIRVIGMGAPREDLPPEAQQPEGVGSIDAPRAARAPAPPIWRSVGPQGRLMALRAARMDALRRLAERIKGLRLTARTQVRDFVTESDIINTELNAFLVGAEEIGQYLHDNELIAEVRLRVPTEQVVKTIKELHSRHYKGNDLKATDIESVVTTVVKRDFEETGMGVPPPQYMRRYVEEVHAPAWVVESIEAEGSGTDPEIDTPQGRLRATRAAEMDARRKLAERIAGLELESATRVRDFVAERDEITTLVDALISDAAVVSTRVGDGAAYVSVSVPAARVWGLVLEGRTRDRRQGRP